MAGRLWGVSHFNNYSYLALTRDRLQETLELLHTEYFSKDIFSVRVGLSRVPEAIRELDELVTSAAANGVSLIVTENTTGKIIGCMINKIHVKYPENIRLNNFFEEFSFRHAVAQTYLKLHADFDNSLNLFGFLKTECYFETMFLCLLPVFQGKGIERELVNISVKMAQCLNVNDNVKVSLDDAPLSVNNAPTALIEITTAERIKQIFQDHGYEQIKEITIRTMPKLRFIKILPRTFVLCKKLP